MKRGISLIVLVITIIVIIILAGAVILNLSGNNPIETAKNAQFKSDLDTFKSELSLYESRKITESLGEFDPKKLNADSSSITYTGSGKISENNMKEIILSIPEIKYDNEICIVSGELAYKGTNEKRQEISQDMGLKLINDNTNVVMAILGEKIVEQGTEIVYTVDIFSNTTIQESEFSKVVKDSFEVINKDGDYIENQPEITIGKISTIEKGKEFEIKVNTTGLQEGDYKLKFKANVLKNSASISNKETISISTFTITSNVPKDPSITTSNTEWTKDPVTATITYVDSKYTNSYSYDGINFTVIAGQTITLNISENTDIYAKSVDSSGNEVGVKLITIANIDKVAPSVELKDISVNNNTLTGKIKLTDTVGIINAVGEIDRYGSKYIINKISTKYGAEDAIWTGETAKLFLNDEQDISYTATSDGNYYIHVLAKDKAGNLIEWVSDMLMSVDNTPPTAPVITPSTTTWTNSNIIVTISYPEDALIKEYSLDGTTWSTYKTAITMSANGTIYAKSTDTAGNQSTQSSLTVDKIDKITPTLVYGTNGASNIKTASTTVTVSDTGESGVNTSTLQYVWSTQNATTPSSGWTTFTNGSALTKTSVTGIYYLWVKVSDNAGNMAVSKTNAFNIDGTAPTVTLGTNGGSNSTQVSTTVTVNDSGSGVNASTLQYIWASQNTAAPSSGWIGFTNGTSLTKTGDGLYYLWIKASDNSGNLVTAVSNQFIVGDVAIPVSTVKTYNATFSGATSGYSYNNPVIPAGFVAVNTIDVSWNNLSTDWNNGLVIQDASGNQFVWVPVDGTNVTYAKWCTTGISYADTSGDTFPSGYTNTSITTTYKGFYIARYESMFDYNGGSIRAASKKSTNKTVSTNWSTTRNSTYNGYLWNYVNYTDAKTYAENMDTSYGYNTSLVGTNLIAAAQWDTALKWIQNSGKSVTDTRTWGNHSDSTSPANVSGYASLQISGYSNNWKAKNIYDLAGNAWEWTNEIYSSWRVSRGGVYNGSGSAYPADIRINNGAAFVGYSMGFRVALYVL